MYNHKVVYEIWRYRALYAIPLWVSAITPLLLKIWYMTFLAIIEGMSQNRIGVAMGVNFDFKAGSSNGYRGIGSQRKSISVQSSYF
jgi:hypothetical protein